ncbi:MAG: tetratricopeptide repeat protein [Kofleriaceae bacterium]
MKSVVLCAAVLWPALAFAEPKTADDWYKEGETQYNLGNFDKAADAFKQGYALETVDNKKPAYLYNVAQAYRQGKECKDAAFFYKRYVSLKDQDTAKPLAADKRTEIEGWINELEDCEKNQESIAHKTPDTTIPAGPVGTNPTTTTTTKPTTTTVPTKVADTGGGDGDGDGGATDGGDVHGSTTIEQPKLLSLRLTGGVAKVGAGNSTVPIEPTFNLFAGYPIAVSPELVIDVGANIGFTPVPYTNSMTNAKATGQLISALADVGATYAVAPKIGLRGDLGVGVLVFGGISDAGNPFTAMGASTTGALGMFAVRAAVSVDYAFTPNVYGTVTPIAFSYSPAKTGLRDDIKSLTRLDFMLGIGYRM